MGELILRCPRGPRSGADAGREVLAREGGAGGEEVGGVPLWLDIGAILCYWSVQHSLGRALVAVLAGHLTGVEQRANANSSTRRDERCQPGRRGKSDARRLARGMRREGAGNERRA